MFRTLIAKFPGTCQRCKGPIAIGDKVRWAAGKGTYHLADDCDRPTVQPQAQPELVPVMTAALAADIRQTFTSLLDRPARLADIEQKTTVVPDTADDRPTSIKAIDPIMLDFDRPQPQPTTRRPIIRSTPQTIDADLF